MLPGVQGTHPACFGGARVAATIGRSAVFCFAARTTIYGACSRNGPVRRRAGCGEKNVSTNQTAHWGMRWRESKAHAQCALENACHSKVAPTFVGIHACMSGRAHKLAMAQKSFFEHFSVSQSVKFNHLLSKGCRDQIMKRGCERISGS